MVAKENTEYHICFLSIRFLSDLIAFTYEHLRLENKIFLDRSKGKFMCVPYLMRVPSSYSFFGT